MNQYGSKQKRFSQQVFNPGAPCKVTIMCTINCRSKRAEGRQNTRTVTDQCSTWHRPCTLPYCLRNFCIYTKPENTDKTRNWQQFGLFLIKSKEAEEHDFVRQKEKLMLG